MLGYYGYHVVHILDNNRFYCLWITIVILAIIRTILKTVDIIFPHAILYQGDACGFVWGNFVYMMIEYFISEFCPILMIIMILHP